MKQQDYKLDRIRWVSKLTKYFEGILCHLHSKIHPEEILREKGTAANIAFFTENKS